MCRRWFVTVVLLVYMGYIIDPTHASSSVFLFFPPRLVVSSVGNTAPQPRRNLPLIHETLQTCFIAPPAASSSSAPLSRTFSRPACADFFSLLPSAQSLIARVIGALAGLHRVAHQRHCNASLPTEKDLPAPHPASSPRKSRIVELLGSCHPSDSTQCDKRAQRDLPRP